jgi:PRTRC genetic system protein C
MSNQSNTTSEAGNAAPLKRVFKVGTNRIVEDTATAKLTNEQVRKLLAAQYPEVANATIRETTNGETRIVEYLPQPGRKG